MRRQALLQAHPAKRGHTNYELVCGQVANFGECLYNECHGGKTFDEQKFLSETYILDFVKPHFQNKRLELVKNPKAYFLDTGMRNKIIDNFSKVSQRADMGQLAENYIFSVLRQSFPFPKRINFWRTKSQAEVDFVVEHRGEIIPIEVKYAPLGRLVIGKSMHSFINKYSPKKAIITTTGDAAVKKINKTEVHFTPIYLLKF